QVEAPLPGQRLHVVLREDVNVGRAVQCRRSRKHGGGRRNVGGKGIGLHLNSVLRESRSGPDTRSPGLVVAGAAAQYRVARLGQPVGETEPSADVVLIDRNETGVEIRRRQSGVGVLHSGVRQIENVVADSQVQRELLGNAPGILHEQSVLV